MNTGHEDYEQSEVFALLTGISVSGLRTRITGRPTDVFVTVAVDGEQQYSSEVICDNLQPVWVFPEPRRLSVYPSSTVKFTVYRRRRTLEMIPDKYIGEFEAPLYTFINEGDVKHDLVVSHISREKGSISVELHIDTSQVPHYPPNILQYASDKLDQALNAHAQERERHPVLKSAGSIVSHAMSSLDHLVAIADDVAEVHPIAKVAWTLFSAVYKSIQHRREMDKVSRGLLLELKDALAEVRECQNLKALQGATDAVKSLAELVAEGATLIDEYMKHASPVRAVLVAWGSIENRIRECQSRLEKLRQQLLRVLVIRIHQNVAERTPTSTGLAGTGPRPNRTPSPPPTMPNSHSPADWMPEGQQYPPVAGVNSTHPPPTHQFPMPTLYPFVKEITTSPDALNRSKELPDTGFFFATSKEAPAVPTRRSSPALCRRPAQRGQSPSREETTGSIHETDPEHLKQLRAMFPAIEDSILETVLASAHGSVENAAEVLHEMSRSPSSLPEDEYPTLRRPPSPLRLGCTEVLGLKVFTESPRSLPPPLSRTQSSADESDVSALPTPDTTLFEETYLRGPSHDGTVSITRTSSGKSTSSIGSDRYYDGFTGGFCPPRVANRMYGPAIEEPNPQVWIPSRPLRGF